MTVPVDLPPLNDEATDRQSLLFLYALLAYLQPKTIVEAGTYHGHFSVAAARLLPDSIVLTADPTRHSDLPNLPNLRAFSCDFEEMLSHLKLGSVDFAFIDSGPPFPVFESDIRWRHWQACKPYMTPTGVMACHDTNNLAWDHGKDIVAEGTRLVAGRGLTLWSPCS